MLKYGGMVEVSPRGVKKTHYTVETGGSGETSNKVNNRDRDWIFKCPFLML